ncbi:MAG: phosphoribosylglycinamide formyltransferase, partial [candidate division WOR-3 bacterium]
MKSIVILASGNGSNFEAIVRKIVKNNWPITVKALITDNPLAYAIQRARRLKVPTIILDYKSFKSKEDYNKTLLEKLVDLKPDLVVLAGYMRILPPFIVERFRYRIINIHPALLPAFPGLNAIERAYKAGCKITGITIHYVDEGVDTGPIIEQAALRIRKGESLEELERRI